MAHHREGSFGITAYDLDTAVPQSQFKDESMRPECCTREWILLGIEVQQYLKEPMALIGIPREFAGPDGATAESKANDRRSG